MKLLTTELNSDYTINLAKSLDPNLLYDDSTIFHCYWNGSLNIKHLYSIKSCYYFNIHKRNSNKPHKIILWLENNIENKFNDEIKKYAEIKIYDYNSEKNNTFFVDYVYNSDIKSYHSDFVRSVLLYNYGGCWFDLDCFFLRNFDPLFCTYKEEICVYQWREYPYPNNAIYISLNPKSEKMKFNMNFVIESGRCWGFQQSNLTYDLNMDLLVLPYTWFDVGWSDDLKININNFLTICDEKYNFENFYDGTFCFHWHNKWSDSIHETSVLKQLIDIIEVEI